MAAPLRRLGDDLAGHRRLGREIVDLDLADLGGAIAEVFGQGAEEVAGADFSLRPPGICIVAIGGDIDIDAGFVAGDVLPAGGDVAGHPWRPAHLHFRIRAAGYSTLITHIFKEPDPYLDSDAVFGVRSSLNGEFVEHAPGTAPDGSTLDKRWFTLDQQLVLAPV